MDTIWEQRAKEWGPPVVAREDIHRFTGIYTARTLANLDTLGQGPAQRIRIGGRKIAYPMESLVAWLNKRSELLATEDAK